ncbi:hypothetical protein FO519_007858 [Halicephalobus sp. NKZ332]|nr:hypothetical protein FO519_007858 [Halicephalobus sp. NKZ332]
MMDAFYIPWMASVLKPEEGEKERSLEGTQFTIPRSLSESTTPRFKLTFFPAKGMAEVIRLTLAYAGEPFIDNRIGFPEWEKRKHEVPFQQMPFLEFDGKILCQSAAIARFLAKQFNLAGKDLFEQAEVDALVDLVKDFGVCIKPWVNSIIKAYSNLPPELDNISPAEGLLQYASPAIERYMPIFENLASKKTKSGFLFDGGITFADFGLVNVFEVMEAILPEKMSKFENIKALKERIFALPRLQKYLNERPKTIL